MELQTNILPLNTPKSFAARTEKVGKQFESVFMYQVLELMSPDIDKDNPFSGGVGEEMFRPILNEYIANEITERGGLGISEGVEKQIGKYREAGR